MRRARDHLGTGEQHDRNPQGGRSRPILSVLITTTSLAEVRSLAAISRATTDHKFSEYITINYIDYCDRFVLLS